MADAKRTKPPGIKPKTGKSVPKKGKTITAKEIASVRVEEPRQVQANVFRLTARWLALRLMNTGLSLYLWAR